MQTGETSEGLRPIATKASVGPELQKTSGGFAEADVKNRTMERDVALALRVLRREDCRRDL
ncbi:MAG TPA: hypothetical protein VNF00_05300 [Candidatus Acidoferrales bacterium]|nr:hypothetical protein [Candidatus Acidoferrales bacterium]